MANLEYSRLGGTIATFQQMMQGFGVVTVMNARVYETTDTLGTSAEGVETIVSKVLRRATADDVDVLEKSGKAPICRLKTLKIANATQEGPTKTVTGGQYANPLIKFGKSMRLEMQDALGNAAALDALCGTVSETGGTNNALDYTKVGALHVTEDFNGPKTIIGDTFFIDAKTGQQVKALIVFYQFLPDSIFNLTQDAEGDATVFDMNGDLLTTDILIDDQEGNEIVHGAFYTILDPKEVAVAAS